MNTHLKQLFLPGMVFAILVSSQQNCSDVRLHRIVPPPEPPVVLKSVGTLCTTLPETKTSKTKYLFVMDKSGSNIQTDPGAQRREGGARTFWQERRDDPDTEWGMMQFRGEEAIGLITDGTQLPVFSSEPADMEEALDLLQGGDNGQTPYGAALALAKLAISTDMDRNPKQNAFYMVFFVSDGVPTDVTDTAVLKGLVNDLVSLDPDHIYLSTGFYGPNNTAATNRLFEMSRSGNGKFVNYNNDNFNFDDLLVKPPQVDAWIIKNLLVYNLNAGFCVDGTVDSDSDGDGLCDKDEIALADKGFDPQSRFSFGGSFGDLFHWRVLKFGEILPECDDRSDADHDFLTFCEEKYIQNQTPAEGISSVASPENPDSDYDGFLDGIEAMIFYPLSMTFALDPTNLVKNTYDDELEDTATQIEQHRHPLFPDADAHRYDTSLLLQEVNDLGQTCYSFQQDDLQVLPTLPVDEENTLPGMGHGENENVISIHFLQNQQSDPNGMSLLNFSLQTLLYEKGNENQGNSLVVNDEVFEIFDPNDL